jgi:hypothetical protein
MNSSKRRVKRDIWSLRSSKPKSTEGRTVAIFCGCWDVDEEDGIFAVERRADSDGVVEVEAELDMGGS